MNELPPCAIHNCPEKGFCNIAGKYVCGKHLIELDRREKQVMADKLKTLS